MFPLRLTEVHTPFAPDAVAPLINPCFTEFEGGQLFPLPSGQVSAPLVFDVVLL